MNTAICTECGIPDGTLSIHKAGFGDAKRLISLLAELCAVEEDFHFDAERQLRGLELLTVSPMACVLIAEECGVAVGMCTGQLVISTAEGGLSVLVEDVVVTLSHRGRGLGRLLLTELTRWGAKQGATRMQLLADKNNRSALDFYDHCGWKATSMICLRTTDLRTTEAHP